MQDYVRALISAIVLKIKMAEEEKVFSQVKSDATGEYYRLSGSADANSVSLSINSGKLRFDGSGTSGYFSGLSSAEGSLTLQISGVNFKGDFNGQQFRGTYSNNSLYFEDQTMDKKIEYRAY